VYARTQFDPFWLRNQNLYPRREFPAQFAMLQGSKRPHIQRRRGQESPRSRALATLPGLRTSENYSYPQLRRRNTKCHNITLEPGTSEPPIGARPR
jgi:hypothetical protein